MALVRPPPSPPLPSLHTSLSPTHPLSDDETLIIFANESALISLDAATGDVVANVLFAQAPMHASSCTAQMVCAQCWGGEPSLHAPHPLLTPPRPPPSAEPLVHHHACTHA